MKINAARLLASSFLVCAFTSVALAQSQGRMSGKVIDHEGNPVSDAVVRLVPQDENGTEVEAKTKKKGNYLIGMIRPGSYKLAVEAPGGLVILRLTGNAVDLTSNKKQLWEVDTEITADHLPPINVGYMNQIVLDVTVGPASLTPEAKAAAAAREMQDSYASGLGKVKAGDHAGALADLEPLLAETPDHAGTNYLVAYAKTQLGRFDEALPLVDHALAIDPAFVGAHVLRGRILMGLGRNDEAEQELNAEIETATDPGVKLEALVALASLYERTNRLPEAVAKLEAASTADPRRELLLSLSDLYARTGDREKAAATLERAEKAGGMDDVAWLNLAIGSINDKKYDQAEQLASRLLEKGSTDSNLSVAHSILARCDLNRGKMDEGKTHLKKALELDPKSPLAAENRDILAALGK